MLKIDQIKAKNVLLRADLDVPVRNGRVENDFRLKAMIPTIKFCLEHARRTCVVGHLGRPTGYDPEYSIVPVQESLKRLINQDINLIDSGFSPGECWTGESPISMMDNIRFDSREMLEDGEFAHQLSQGADVYIYEAFANYRDSTTLRIIPEIVPTVTGTRFDLEVSTLRSLLENPSHPTLLIASGAKEDKLSIIHQIQPRFDLTLLGGKFAAKHERTPDGLDLNEETTSLFTKAISEAKTVVLNGPLGYYEDGIHTKATKAVFEALKSSRVATVLGGGDTLSAIPSLGFEYTDFGFVSTGGGAMLEFLATGSHPLLSLI